MNDENALQLLRDACVRVDVAVDEERRVRYLMLNATQQLAAAEAGLRDVWERLERNGLYMGNASRPRRNWRRRLKDAAFAFRAEWSR